MCTYVSKSRNLIVVKMLFGECVNSTNVQLNNLLGIVLNLKHLRWPKIIMKYH